MTAKFFVDTNVLVYIRDQKDPAKQASAVRWLASLKTRELAVVSYQVIQEYYHVVTRKFAHGLTKQEARDDVRDFLSWKPVVSTPLLLDMAWQMQDAFRLAWWDCLILAAAKTGGCAFLLSEDFTAGQDYDGVKVINPFATEPADVLR